MRLEELLGTSGDCGLGYLEWRGRIENTHTHTHTLHIAGIERNYKNSIRTSGTVCSVGEVGLVGGDMVGLLTLLVFQLRSPDEGDNPSLFEVRLLNNFLDSRDRLPFRDFFPLFSASSSAMGDDSRLLISELGGVSDPGGGVTSMLTPSAGSAFTNSS